MDRNSRFLTFHSGKKCKSCGNQNFTGLRFHCLRCQDFDLCNNCQDHLVENHTADHPMQAVMLIKQDSPLFYKNEEFCPQSFTCSFCGKRGFSPAKIVAHFVECIGRTPLPDRPVLDSVCCSLCVAESRCYHPARFDHSGFWNHIIERHELYISVMNNPNLVSPINLDLPLPSTRSQRSDIRSFFPTTSRAASSHFEARLLEQRQNRLLESASGGSFQIMNVELGPLSNRPTGVQKRPLVSQRSLTLSELLGPSFRQSHQQQPEPPPRPTQKESYPLLSEILEQHEQGYSPMFSDEIRDFVIRVMRQTLVEPIDDFQLSVLFPEETVHLYPPEPWLAKVEAYSSSEESVHQLPDLVSPTALLAAELAGQDAPSEEKESNIDSLTSPGHHSLLPTPQSTLKKESVEFDLQALSSDYDPYCSEAGVFTQDLALEEDHGLSFGSSLSEDFGNLVLQPRLEDEVLPPTIPSDLSEPHPLERTSSEAQMLDMYFTSRTPSQVSLSHFLGPPSTSSPPTDSRTAVDTKLLSTSSLSKEPLNLSTCSIVSGKPRATQSLETVSSSHRLQQTEVPLVKRASTSLLTDTSSERQALPRIPSDIARFQYTYSTSYVDEWRSMSDNLARLANESSTLIERLRDIHSQADILVRRMYSFAQVANTFYASLQNSQTNRDTEVTQTSAPQSTSEPTTSTSQDDHQSPSSRDSQPSLSTKDKTKD